MKVDWIQGCRGCVNEMEPYHHHVCTECSDHDKHTDRKVIKIMSENDVVNNPSHYMLFPEYGVEVRDLLEVLLMKIQEAPDKNVPAKTLMFESDYVQMMQYVLRFMQKNGKEDLEKGRYFLDKMIEAYEHATV